MSEQTPGIWGTPEQEQGRYQRLAVRVLANLLERSSELTGCAWRPTSSTG